MKHLEPMVNMDLVLLGTKKIPLLLNIGINFFLFLNQNICCVYSKEPSHLGGYFEFPKLMLKPMSKKIIIFTFFLFIQTFL